MPPDVDKCTYDKAINNNSRQNVFDETFADQTFFINFATIAHGTRSRCPQGRAYCVVIRDVKSGQFLSSRMISKVLTSMLYIHLKWLYTIWRGLLFII